MKRCLLTTVLAVANLLLLANNIAVRNVALTGNNISGHYTLIKFDLSWDNSWRVSTGPSNWDAAWVFAKYRVQGDTLWHHVTLHWVDGSGTGDGHTVPAGAVIASSNDNGAGGARGVFIYHNAPMSQGSVSYTGAQLRWDYGVDSVGDADLVEVKVFAIEMVYVPQGSFYVGTGGGEVGAFYTYPDTTQPYHVTSEGAIPVGTTNGALYYKTGVPGDYLGPVPDSFPKGYQAFYCMKYEITQDQYVAFLNVLDSAQALQMSISNTNSVRNGITQWTIQHPLRPEEYTTSNPYVPANMSIYDLCGYLDWAALRPMTELEYEKACRGPVTPVQNEFAWGSRDLQGYNAANGTLTSARYKLTDPGTANEYVDTNYSVGSGNAVWLYNAIFTPNYYITRAGAFAGSPGNSGRITAGATYYGIMEMAGNMVEQIITMGYPEGRAFTGRPGDGRLAATGFTDEGNWPARTTLYQGSGNKGGYYNSSSPFDLMVSDRRIAADNFAFFSGKAGNGGRGVRTAP
ncbi:MAG TPA: SUMF1/EgtB/PvdO family nonheme iron enzyme [Puia sp.]|nr:SUMF1/EgtB/PvdO family nonheme iron enzyme [Puia sp.]